MTGFKHHDLGLLNPSFDSHLVDVITELEHLRRLQLAGTTPAPVFFQLKEVFHILESLGSARIEGNHTTLADYVEIKLEGRDNPGDQLQEVLNIERAMAHVEESVKPDSDITQRMIREWHSMAVQGLEREGDRTPGRYRDGTVTIARSDHTPPDAFMVPGYMDELVDFINAPDPRKYDLIKVALAHHRFAWIHPFRNGNGRVVRLFTYAMLIKYGFNVQAGNRILNPTAVFCNDRDMYYQMLSLGDSGSPQDLETWCEYVLEGILEELRKVDQLTRFDYLRDRILLPTLRQARERRLITEQEADVLAIAAREGVIKAADVKPVLSELTRAQRTYQIGKLVSAGMLQPIREGARQYILGFDNNYLMRGIIAALTEEGFIPETLNHPDQ